MPNLSAAKKSLRSDERKRVYNLRRNRKMKEVIKDITDLLQKGKVKEATAMLPAAYKAIDKATKRGVIKRNTAARKKSLIAKQVREAATK